MGSLARFLGPSGRSAALALALQAVGCGAVPDEPLAWETQAVNVCDETVPENRFVDGLPAYAQCDTTTGSIWSNNGVDTATSSQGSDWIRTQQGGGYQCTEWAYRYMHFRWDIDYRHGDAREWCDGMLPATLVKSEVPVHGDLIIFDGGACGADATTGHIAVVDTVDAAKAKVTIVEENRAGRRSTDQSCATCFLHAVANDGSVAGAPGTGGAAGSAGTAGGGGSASGAGGTPAAAGMSTSGGAETGGRGPRAGAGGMAGAPSPDDGGAPAGDSGRGGGSTAGAPGAGGTSQGGSAGQSSTGAGGTAPNGTGGSAGSGGSGATAGQGAPNAAGRDGTEGEDLLLAETNDGGGCAVRPRRGDGGLGVLVLLLGFVASRRRARSRARAA